MSSTGRLGRINTVRRMDAAEHRAGKVITSGDFRIDLSARNATLRGEELRLSSEEFHVLVYLVNHRQGVVTPNTMLATRWTRDTVRQVEFLRILLGLMRKIEAAGGSAQHYLRTESWVAYRFASATSPV